MGSLFTIACDNGKKHKGTLKIGVPSFLGYFEFFEIFEFEKMCVYSCAMKKEEILYHIIECGVAEEIWLGISLAKVNTMVHYKTGLSLLEMDGINPTMVRELLDLTINEISEILIKKLRTRN